MSFYSNAYFNSYRNVFLLYSYFSLSIRLAANILAGHTLVYIISSFILKMSI